MMLYPPMDELLKQVPSRYKLVNVVAARARRIASQAESQGIMLEDKPVSIAVREIAGGYDEEVPAELEATLREEEAPAPEDPEAASDPESFFPED